MCRRVVTEILESYGGPEATACMDFVSSLIPSFVVFGLVLPQGCFLPGVRPPAFIEPCELTGSSLDDVLPTELQLCDRHVP